MNESCLVWVFIFVVILIRCQLLCHCQIEEKTRSALICWWW